MSRRGRDAKARERRHRAAVALRSESSATTGLAMASVARASDVEAKPVVATHSAAESPERPAAVATARAPSPRRQKVHRRQQPVVPSELEHLRDLVSAREAAAAAVDDEVRRLRRRGANWPEIGDALGVSRQAARQRFLPYG
jgi:hypothetical protein